MRPRRGVVGAALLAVLATGCTGESEPEAAPAEPTTPTQSESLSASPSPSESESAKADEPTPPPTALKHTDKGAIAFAQHFVDVLNYTASSGDLTNLQRISTTGCESCQNILEVTKKTYDDGGYIRGDGWSVDSYSVFKPGASEKRIVSLRILTSAQVYKPSSTGPVEKSEGEKSEVTVYLRPSREAWIVTRMDRVDS